MDDLGVARGTIIINTSPALASLAALRASSRAGVESLNTIGRASVRGGAGIAAFGAVIVAGFALAVKKTAELESKMSFIKGITGLTAVEMEKVRQKTIDLGQSSAFTALEVADGFIELSKAGATQEQMIGGMGDAMITLGQSADISLEKSATTLVSVASTFGIAIKDSAHIADIIQGAANASIISVEDMTVSMKYAGGVAANLGLSLEDTATSIAILGQAGIRGSTAGTSLRRIFLQLTPRTLKAEKAMKALGIITKDGSNRFYDATGKAKKLSEITEILRTSTAKLTPELRQKAFATIFGDRAINSAIALSKGGSAAFDKMYKAVGNVKAADVAAERLNNLAGAWEIFKGSIDSALISAGTPAQEPLKQLVQTLTKMVNAFTNLSDAAQKWIVKGLLGTAVASLAVGGFLIFFGTILRVIAIFKELGVMMAFVKARYAGMLAARGATGLLGLIGPVGWLIAAIALLVAAFVGFFIAAYKNSAPLRKALSDIGNTIKTALIPVIKKAKEIWKTLVDGFNRFAKGSGDKMSKAVLVFADSIVALIEGFNGLKGKQGGIVGFFHMVGQVLKKAWLLAVIAFNGIKAAVTSFIDGFKGKGKAKDGPLGFFQELGEKARWFKDQVVARIQMAFSGIMDAVSSFISGFQGKATGKDGPLGFFETLGEKIRWFKDEVVERAKNAFTGIRDAVVAFIDGFTGKSKEKDGPIGFFERLGEGVRWLQENVIQKLKDAFTGIVDAVKAFIAGFTGEGDKKDGPLGFFEKLGAAVRWLQENVITKLEAAFGGIRDAVKAFIDGFTGNATGKDGPVGFFERMGVGIRYFTDNIIPTLKQAFQSIVDAVSTFVGAFTSSNSTGDEGPVGFFERLGTAIRFFKDDVVVKLQTALDGIRDAWTNFTGGFSGESTGKDGPIGVFEKLGTVIAWIKNDMVPAIQDGLEQISSAWTNFSDGISGKTEEVEGMGGAFFTWGETMKPIGEVFKSIGDNISQNLMPALQNLWDTLTSSEAFQDIAKTVREELYPALQDLWKTIQEDLWPALKELFEALKPVFTVIGVVLGIALMALGVLIDMIVSTLTFIIKLVTVIIETIINILTPIINMVVSIITAIVDIISGIIKVFSAILTNDWGLLWEGILEILKGTWDAIAAVFVGAWNVIYAIVEGLIRAIVEIFQWLWDVLVGHSIVPDMVNDIVAWFAGLPGKIFGFLVELVTTVVTKFIEIATTVITNIAQFIVDVVQFFIDLPGKVWEQLMSLVTTLASFGITLFNTAAGLGAQIRDGIMGVITELPGLIWDNLTNAVGTVANFAVEAYNKAFELGSNLWNGFKDAMGIHSPSYIEQAMTQVTATTGTELTTFTGQIAQFKEQSKSIPDIVPKLADIPMPAQVVGNPQYDAYLADQKKTPQQKNPFLYKPDPNAKPAWMTPQPGAGYAPPRPGMTGMPTMPGGKPYVPPVPADVAELKGIRGQLTLLLSATKVFQVYEATALTDRKALNAQIVLLNGIALRHGTGAHADAVISHDSLRALVDLERAIFARMPVTPPPPTEPRPMIFQIETVEDGDSLLRRARANDRMLALAEGGDSPQLTGLGD